MLTGPQLIRMVRDRRITGLEAHIASLYEMRATELTSHSAAILASMLATWGTLAVAFVTAPSNNRDGAQFAVAFALLSFIPIGFLAIQASRFGVHGQNSEVAKHYANQLRRIWPRRN